MLQRSRPEAPEALVESIAARVETTARRRRVLFAPSRIFALVLTLAMLGMLAGFGGIAYATTALVGATHAVTRVVSPNPVTRPAFTPAQAQYVTPGSVKSAAKTIVSGSRKSSGVKGATETITSGSDLPFTGFDLMLVIGGGLLLVLVGGGLRRFSGNRQ
jgi:hypothetical protein